MWERREKRIRAFILLQACVYACIPRIPFGQPNQSQIDRPGRVLSAQGTHLDWVPYRPPKAKGSRGTGMPTLTPIMPARNLVWNHAACAPTDV